ncbi:MAG: FtsK/SpoIIIE domain-containing protein [Streptosporangiaceae bacterium]
MLSRISDRPGVTPPGPAPAREHQPRRRALETGLLVTAGVYAAGTVLSAFRLPALTLAVGCLTLGAVIVVATLIKGEPGLRTSYVAACGGMAAAWLGSAGALTPWAWPAAATLALAAAALISLYPVVVARERRAAAEAFRAAVAARTRKDQRRWPDLLDRIGHPGVLFAGREDTLAGYLVHLRLPGSGRVTYSALAPATEKLEVAARLRHGSLRFERGDQAHKVILHVAERDVLSETVLFPEAGGALSIVNPIPIGLFEDGRVCAVTLREMATLIVGLRGSGKSNLLNVLLAQLSRCADVLIFAIDLKGGRMAAPWIEPWLAGRSPRPVVDWLATDREEAERMLRALLRAVQARSRSGSGGEKIIPSARQPAILLVCDEIAVILGMGMGGPRFSAEGVTNTTLSGLATRLVMTGRSEAIDLIMATQRATPTMTGSADLKSQCALRIGLGVSSESDARLIIPDDIQIAADLARLRHPGTGIVQQGKLGRVMPVKFFRIEHEAISEIAERYGDIRPGPDALLEEALGEDYARRWDPDRAAGIPGVASRAAVATMPAHLALESVVPAAVGTGEDLEDVEPGRRRMVVMLQVAGVKGMTIRSIADQLAAAGQDAGQQAIRRWLDEELAFGRVADASYGRWKWRGGSGG